MNSNQIKINLEDLVNKLNHQEFIYDFLLAYGISKTSITRLKKGDFNLSKIDGEVLYKNKIYFKTEESDRLLIAIEESANDEKVLKYNPRFIITTDFETIVSKDLKTKLNRDFPIIDLPRYFDFFLPLTGAEIYKSSNDNKADRDAAYKLGQLYEILVIDNPDYRNESHNLNIFLSRLLFCFFAEDTGIFEKKSVFTETLSQHTSENGNNVDDFLNQLFQRLNSKDGSFAAYLEQFPYVNGGLFRDNIKSPKFSAKARRILIECGDLDWSEINPDIFGSMIQAVADPEERSDLGMHYTSVPNIKKLIEPLFLDELYEDFQKNFEHSNNLKRLINRIAKMKFFDPACGSGNFLIITYKEIRLLEIKIIQRLIDLEKQRSLFFTTISLSQFYGIEIKDFAHEMAILSLWLAEHQMNKIFETELEDYGQSNPILPLKEAGRIVCSNATRISWDYVCPKNIDDEIYILGNPPYLGYSRQDKEQKKDIDLTFVGINNYKKLDYIACWFYKATQYIQNTNCKYAFVTTNSITQGEQVALLWPIILNKNQEISFAYQSFKWSNNAKGNAGVAVVIIGIRNVENKDKFLYNKNLKQIVKNISPYLINFGNLIVKPQRESLSNFSEMIIGSKISDDSNLILEPEEREKLIIQNPKTEMYLKKYIGAQEFMNSTFRYCIHITEETEKDAYAIPELVERFEKVKTFRLKSQKESTIKKAEKPHFFDEDKHQSGEFILVPQTGSERREYLPVGYFDGSYLPSNATRVIYNADAWLFGVISSRMHIVWIKAIAGRLKTDMQYSNTLCYNTFPFPEINAKQKEAIHQYVFQVLDERSKYSEKTMAWMYNPDTMPKGLKQAHKELDEAIERIYRLNPFQSDIERLEFLFKLYEETIKKNTLFVKQKNTRIKRVK